MITFEKGDFMEANESTLNLPLGNGNIVGMSVTAPKSYLVRIRIRYIYQVIDISVAT